MDKALQRRGCAPDLCESVQCRRHRGDRSLLRARWMLRGKIWPCGSSYGKCVNLARITFANKPTIKVDIGEVTSLLAKTSP